MIFWFYMLVIVLLIPAIMFGVGLTFKTHPPRTPNGFWGYRTGRSVKTQQTWDYANRYMGRIWYHWGLILLPLSVVPMLFFIGAEPDTISYAATAEALLQLIPLIASVFLTEKALKAKFREDGTPRDEEA